MGQSRGRLCPQRMGLCGHGGGGAGSSMWGPLGSREPAPRGPRESRTRATPGGQPGTRLPPPRLAGWQLMPWRKQQWKAPRPVLWDIKPGPDAGLVWWPFGFPGGQHCANGLYVPGPGQKREKVGPSEGGKSLTGVLPPLPVSPGPAPFPRGRGPTPQGSSQLLLSPPTQSWGKARTHGPAPVPGGC